MAAATTRYCAKLALPLANPERATAIWAAQSAGLRSTPSNSIEHLAQRLERAVEDAAALYHRERQALVTREVTGLGNFPTLFPAARAMQRKFIFFAGPTNSGKTHAGFELLIKAQSGLYLAPLRLLALEGQERIESAGVVCDLVTGEERVHRPNSRHIAATIEMVDTEKPVDVVMIDEIQLLDDPDRGWAWTQACLGVAAPLVILTGSAEAEPLVRCLVALTGDELEIRYCERLSPLSALPIAVKFTALEPGDAIIAFSRRDVLMLRDAMLDRKHSVAVIYGALGPEVRRAEAARFRSGEAQILVATDAIGMGLNLPIRRVLFSTLEKFDGISERPLRVSEIKQIGGRAGRFKQHEAGFVGVLSGISAKPVSNALDSPNRASSLQRFWVQPPWRAVQHVAAELQTTKITPVIEHIAKVVLNNDPRWCSPIGEDHIAMATLLDNAPLSLRLRYEYLGTPIDTRTQYACDQLLRWLRGHAAERRVTTPGLRTGTVPDSDRALETLEQDAKVITAYLWLDLRWPSVYPQETEARAAQQQANQWIAEALRAKRLQRVCRTCSRKLSTGHRFAICDDCFRAQRSEFGDNYW